MSKSTGVARLFEGRVYYGWILLPVAFVCYGLAISPSYSGWGFFAPEVREELGLSRTQIGAVASVFTLFYQVVSPLAALLIARIGLRRTVTIGCLITAAGQWLVSEAQSLWACYLYYAIIAGSGVALSSVLPMQTLATYWFKRYRARALAVIMAGSTTLGSIFAQLNDYVLQHGGWRLGWQVYSAISILAAIIVAIFFRDRPEDLGLRVDGEQDPRADAILAQRQSVEPVVLARETAPAHQWSAREAIFTIQFALITLCSVGQVGCWTVFTAHGRLHLDAMAFSSTAVAALISIKDLMSSTGRLLGSAGDFVSPRHLLTTALLIEALGLGAMVFVDEPFLLYVASMLLGLGHGTAFICIPLTFAQVFGREAFVHTAGTSRLIQGLFTATFPILAGTIADASGTYAIPFLAVSLLSVIGAVGIQLTRPLNPRAVRPVPTVG